MSVIVKIQDLVKYYYAGDNIVKAIDHTDLEIERGKFTAIVGRSGSGKSTLLHMLGGLDRPDSGKVFIDGKDIFKLKENELAVFRRKKIGFIFQDYNLIPSLNVWENIVLPIGLDERKVESQEIEAILNHIGLDDKKESMPNTLSGGQKQRVAIARALASSPAIILADEPTGNLDLKSSKQIFDILKNISREHLVVVVSHDMESAKVYADRIIEIQDGKVISDGYAYTENKNGTVFKLAYNEEDIPIGSYYYDLNTTKKIRAK